MNPDDFDVERCQYGTEALTCDAIAAVVLHLQSGRRLYLCSMHYGREDWEDRYRIVKTDTVAPVILNELLDINERRTGGHG